MKRRRFRRKVFWAPTAYTSPANAFDLGSQTLLGTGLMQEPVIGTQQSVVGAEVNRVRVERYVGSLKCFLTAAAAANTLCTIFAGIVVGRLNTAATFNDLNDWNVNDLNDTKRYLWRGTASFYSGPTALGVGVTDAISGLTNAGVMASPTWHMFDIRPRVRLKNYESLFLVTYFDGQATAARVNCQVHGRLLLSRA